MTITSILALALCGALCSVADAQTTAAHANSEAEGPAPSLGLSPAIIMVRCRPGQSTTQTLTIINRTPEEASFQLATEDVVVPDGRRSFSPPGQIPHTF